MQVEVWLQYSHLNSTTGPVTLTMCDLSGKTVATLYHGEVNGRRMVFNINNRSFAPYKPFSSGMCIVRLHSQNGSNCCKMMIK